MPIYPKGDKFRVVIWMRGVRHDFIHDGPKKEAQLFEARKKLELQAKDPESLGRVVPSFSDFVEGPYRANAKKRLKGRTWSNRTYTLATLIGHFDETKMSAITTAEVEAYTDARLAKKIKATTINDELKVLRAILAYARELHIPLVDAIVRDLPTRGVKRKVTFWTSEQAAKLLNKMGDVSPDLVPIVVFLLNTGCRKGEALALEWPAVDLDRGLVFIQPSEEWQPKDGEAREIPISDSLRPYLEARHISKRWVFPTTRGKRRHERYKFWPQRAFDRAREAAGLDGGPHTTRHTYAAHFLAGGGDIFLLAKILGHSTTYVTELYSHLLPEHLERARNVVNFGAGLKTLPDAVPARKRK
jgi:integrase